MIIKVESLKTQANLTIGDNIQCTCQVKDNHFVLFISRKIIGSPSWEKPLELQLWPLIQDMQGYVARQVLNASSVMVDTIKSERNNLKLDWQDNIRPLLQLIKSLQIILQMPNVQKELEQDNIKSLPKPVEDILKMFRP